MYNKLSILTNYINYGVRNLKSSLSVDTPKLTFKDLFATICFEHGISHLVLCFLCSKPKSKVVVETQDTTQVSRRGRSGDQLLTSASSDEHNSPSDPLPLRTSNTRRMLMEYPFACEINDALHQPSRNVFRTRL